MGKSKSRREALSEAAKPRVRGRVLSTEGDALILDCGGCTIDVPADSIVERRELGDDSVEILVRADAKLVVSTLVTPDKGFVTDNVFGALVEHGMLSDNCNCNCSGGNCNCNCGGSSSWQELQALQEAASFRMPFAGGARREYAR